MIFWTTDELRRLKECYSVMSHDELVKEFPNRTSGAIRVAANKLGVRSNIRRDWIAICNAHKPRIILAQVVPAETR
jgi:hypothetical protein